MSTDKGPRTPPPLDDALADEPTTVSVRVWLSDRPGALGAVAARMGAVGGDVVGIQILERGAGRAVDDVVVTLPSASLVALLVREVNEVDGADVEEVRPIDARTVDPWFDAADLAAELVGCPDRDALLETLARRSHQLVYASWTVVVALDTGAVLCSHGDAPVSSWLSAFVEGSRASARLGPTEQAPLGSEVNWVPLPAAGLALMQGRERSGFRARERRQVAALARVADAWLGALAGRAERAARLSHPAGTALVPAAPATLA